jgi:hypothetical protein
MNSTLALAYQLRNWMFAFLPSVPGAGNAIPSGRDVAWLHIDTDGITPRFHRKISWSLIKKIGVSRSYLDGHTSEIRIYHRGGVSTISLEGLRDGENLVSDLLAMFERAGRTRATRPIARLGAREIETGEYDRRGTGGELRNLIKELSDQFLKARISGLLIEHRLCAGTTDQEPNSRLA